MSSCKNDTGSAPTRREPAVPARQARKFGLCEFALLLSAAFDVVGVLKGYDGGWALLAAASLALKIAADLAKSVKL